MGLKNDIELVWHIGKEGLTSTNLETPPFKAFFTWLRDGQIERTADFTQSELEAEIERFRGVGDDSAPFEAAVKQLRNQSGLG